MPVSNRRIKSTKNLLAVTSFARIPKYLAVCHCAAELVVQLGTSHSISIHAISQFCKVFECKSTFHSHEPVAGL